MADKKRKQLYSAILLGILLVVYLLFFRKENASTSSQRPARPKTTRQQVDHRKADFRHHRIYYTKHGRCRMDCRHIDESEVKEILADGEINYAKSELNAQPCPKYALEGVTHDGQHVRIIVGDCSSQASIVTVIDLENDFECECK